MKLQSSTSPQRPLALFATSLAVAVAALYVVARVFEAAYPGLGYVRSFAEAALVGALADWFAVTALFRRPLGLPIPHTEIVPRSKERIAAGIARFIESNFLAVETVLDRLGASDTAGAFARWATEPANSETVALRLTEYLQAVFEALDREDARRVFRDSTLARLAEVDLGPLVAALAAWLHASGGLQRLVDRALDETATLVADQEPAIRARVSGETAWMWRKLGMDAKVADAAIGVLRETLGQVREDPAHAVRQRADRSALEFIERVRAGQEWRTQIEDLKRAMLAHPVLADYLDSAWAELRAAVLEGATRRGSPLQARLAELVAKIASIVLGDEAVRKNLNRSFRAALVELVESQRAEVRQIIVDTVKRWDARTLTDKVENEIGRDLQYIRVNGTLIGGLVGLALHAISVVLGSVYS